MINQIDIASFGSFSGLDWKKTVRDNGKNVKTFQRLNILYGRNYSGKTTLSRVFRALETRKFPLNYVSPSFTVYGEKGNVTQAGILTHNYEVRVYNRDFVTDNLSFLVNQQIGSEIKTFAIVGEQNKEIDDAIALIEAKLGSVEGKTGLRFDLEAKRKERDRTKTNHSTASNALEDKLRSHAADKIKKNRQYGVPVYTIEHIRRDISATKKPGFVALTLEEQPGKLALLKQEALPDITGTLTISLQFDSLKGSAEPLLSKTISPTKPIQELLNDSVLQLWVKQGIGHHRDKRDTCAFCRQSLPHDIWQTLDQHFSKESGDLETVLENAITSVKDEIAAVASFIFLRSDQFYTEERSAFDTSSKALAEALGVYKKDLESLKKSLETRKINLFQSVALRPSLHDPKEVQKHVNASHEPFFGFGNNLRKFLEAFLFFKYPYHDDRNDAYERIKKFFGEEEDTAIALVNRLNNEFSHLEAVPDRGFKPVEIPEIAKVASYVLDKIYAADSDQYNALLKSIGEPERTH